VEMTRVGGTGRTTLAAKMRKKRGAKDFTTHGILAEKDSIS